MKKIFMSLMLCIVSICGVGQSWDYVKYVVNCADTVTGKKYNWETDKTETITYVRYKVNFNKDYSEYCNNYNKLYYAPKYIYMPTKSVINNYRIGHNCFEAGKNRN